MVFFFRVFVVLEIWLLWQVVCQVGFKQLDEGDQYQIDQEVQYVSDGEDFEDCIGLVYQVFCMVGDFQYGDG